MTLHLVAIVYWIGAVCVSGLIGWHAVTIFSVEPKNKPQLWQQRFLNFVGALSGWTVLWALGIRFWDCLSTPNGYAAVTVGWWDVFGGFIAFIGVTGYLPYTVIGLVDAVFKAGHAVALIAAKSLKLS